MANPFAEQRQVPVLYLDLDGTVREGRDDPLGRFVNRPEDVRVFPEAVRAMRIWRDQVGGRIAGVTNQGGIALGIVSHEAVDAAVSETMRQCDGLIDMVAICPHHPSAHDPVMARCWCRKPSAGAIAGAAQGLGAMYPGERYPACLALMVGDRPEDEQCARAASIDFQWAAKWRAAA